MNFKEFFSFDEHVIPWVAEQIKNASRKKENSSEETTTKERCNAHIVGQVSYKEFIFTWDGRPDKIEKEITHFCTYNLETKEFSILFKHQKVDVVSASLNEERILLAFTVIDYKSPPDDHAKEKLGIYQSLVAEISPPKDVFKLADDHTHGCGCQYQKVEFLYGNYPLYLETSRRESHLLYFVHSKSIDLFHIPLKKINSATLISGNPQVEHLVKKFVWSQFDRSEKRLHYVYSESDDENSLDGLVFSTLQFCEGSRQVPTLKVTCPFFVCSPYQTRFLYNRNPLSKCISESNINMQLVTSHDGSIFLCYQHPIDAHKKSTITQNCEEVVSDIGVDDFDESDSRTTFLEYSVFMLHFGSILKCKVPNVVPEDLVPHCRLLLQCWMIAWPLCYLDTYFICSTVVLNILHAIMFFSQMFCHLASDPANPECLELLKEYLICSTYFQMKFQVESKMFKLFPFSNAEPFRGHLETSRLGEKLPKFRTRFKKC
ncbi:gamma-secretase-activating protein-like isoform X1 [Xenia sp. Carnegie-2017]|uniref:gamma-secretase-activating protein-like isoform X1 n=1 Tax=Xenia sp. Carnegie-2017 TaxID=2897299 RepID=UPI001F040258|nr:gamma-secretase-activating protein-like isoform X1 [Xenia sp. Carnegie-2017]